MSAEEDWQRQMVKLVREVSGPAVLVDVLPGWRPEDGVAVLLSGEEGRTARLVLEGGWCDLLLREDGVGAFGLMDDADDFEERPDEVRALTRLAATYVTGGGRLEHRRSRVLRRQVPVWVATVEGEVWELSRRWSRRGPA
ncbi:hypothetical protein [Aeromicrobium massiliense]|uniref:hypothetical protein n=1 Tax=Aeromicrobium massiliense TaxID=1464554 RepID=UPI0005783732|nr:hypothetical protein [Aeromicrobium massiliense]